MKCPRCDSENTRVTDTARSYRPASTNRKYMVDRVKKEGRVRGEWKANFNNRVDNANVRRRVCSECGTVFLTLESPCYLFPEPTKKVRRAQ